jgi:hypothetical protein
MTNQVNLSSKHNPEWALFLPAISSFYISGLGKQREGENYFEQSRIPQSFPNNSVECLNFLNSKEGLYTYKWALYSAGHANLDITKDDASESIIRKREKGIFLLGDSGGFQILKCQWPADWKDPNCPRAMKKRQEVLRWMDEYMDYGMCLDIPSQALTTYHVVDKKTGKSVHGIKTIEDAIYATHINNEYFINNRDGRCKFLNVLQGRNHKQSDDWYNEMKKYCDRSIYGDRAFNGWAFGGQNKIDIHLMLKRLVNIIHDGYLESGEQDLVHCLGTSIMEYALLFTDIQKAIRKYHNPNFQITYDCASPFFAAAKGLAYNVNTFGHDTKWTYSMEKTAENKKYANDTRKFSEGCLEDGIHSVFTDSPVTELLTMKDVCYRGFGTIGQHGKETKTSWDTLSYTLIQSHNVYQHISAMLEAHERYQNGEKPSMLHHNYINFSELVDEIFSLKDRQKSLRLIDEYDSLWQQFKAGQGFSGKKTVNAHTTSIQLFDGEFGNPNTKESKKKLDSLISMANHFFVEENDDSEEYEEMIDSDGAMIEVLNDQNN